MIDIQTETLIPIGQAARRLPAWTVGKSINPSTVWRWIKSGVRRPDGTRLRLEAVRLGVRYLTSVQALDRFIRAQTPDLAAADAVVGPRTANQRQRAADRAGEALAAVGI